MVGPVQGELFNGLVYEIVGAEVHITSNRIVYEDVTIPNELEGLPVTSIGESAFAGNRNITTIQIPGSVTAISLSAFSNCRNLSKINVDPGNAEFSSVDGILYDGAGTRLLLCPDGFQGPAIIPDGVQTIEAASFQSCWSVTSIGIPATVTDIGARAFAPCDALMSFDVAEANPAFSSHDGILFNKDVTVLVSCPGNFIGPHVMPGSVRSIGEAAFWDCDALTEVSFSSTLRTIETYAFYKCGGLTAVTFPPTLTTIGDYAFSRCSGLTGIVVPGSVQAIGDSAFAVCGQLTSAVIEPGTSSIGVGAFSSCDNLTDVTWPASAVVIGARTFLSCDALVTISLPSTVTTIGEFAFAECGRLVHITIPEHTTLVDEKAFSMCRSLTTVEFRSHSTSIGRSAFESCQSLARVTTDADGTGPFPPASIGVQAFFYCGMLTTMELPAGTTSIGAEAFANCGKLQEIVLPPQITEIGTYAFIYCFELARVELRSAAPTIGRGCFAWCTSLTEVNAVPYYGPSGSGGVIRFHAFLNCNALLSVEIPAGVKTIERDVFNQCYVLSKVVFLGDAPVIDDARPFPVDTIVHYYDSADGFTEPTWMDYQTVNMGRRSPFEAWLRHYGLPLDTPMTADLNGDGVSLLMAYALALDPHQQLSRDFLVPRRDDGNLRVSYHAAAEGVVYRVETSRDLETWTTDGVTLSELDSEGRQVASIRVEEHVGFLQLTIEVAE